MFDPYGFLSILSVEHGSNNAVKNRRTGHFLTLLSVVVCGVAGAQLLPGVMYGSLHCSVSVQCEGHISLCDVFI